MPGRFSEMVFLRYLAASGFALVADLATFMLLLSLAMAAAAAAAAGYAMGIAAHWLISTRAVFIGAVAERGVLRHRQKALFVGSALAGLALTTSIVGVGAALGLDPRLGKAAAIAASFMLTWLLRERIVFRRADVP